MPTDIALRCACGALQGRLEAVSPQAGTRVVCHCRFCQAFVETLGQAGTVLDARGGSDIFQTAAGRVVLERGAEHLACLRLTDKGPLRWYASCCHTPLANTLATATLPLASVLVSVLDDPDEAALGPVRAVVNTADARPGPDGAMPKPYGMAGTIVRFARLMLVARVTGRYAKSPFFGADGAPVSPPRRVPRGARVAEAEPGAP